MNDKNNTNKENSPFFEEPFSVDVWERAYKNVGKPFEKKAFDSSSQDIESEISSQKEATATNNTNRKESLQKTKSKKEVSQKPAPSKSLGAYISTKASVTPAERPTYEPQPTQRSHYDYTPNENKRESPADQKRDNKNTDFFEMFERAFEQGTILDMIKNAFAEGTVLDMLKNIPNLVRNAFGKRKSNEQSPFSMMWIVIAIFIILLALFGNG